MASNELHRRLIGTVLVTTACDRGEQWGSRARTTARFRATNPKRWVHAKSTAALPRTA